MGQPDWVEEEHESEEEDYHDDDDEIDDIMEEMARPITSKIIGTRKRLRAKSGKTETEERQRTRLGDLGRVAAWVGRAAFLVDEATVERHV